jgi:hypothetical protein
MCPGSQLLIFASDDKSKLEKLKKELDDKDKREHGITMLYLYKVHEVPIV